MIVNRTELATSRVREHVLDMIEAGITAVLPASVMRSSLRYEAGSGILTAGGKTLHLKRGRVFVIGGGKASASMARTLEDMIGADSITAGIVTTKDGPGSFDTQRIRIAFASHPIPDERGVVAVRQMLELKSLFSIGAEDTVLCLVSGGGSALMPCPADGITLAEKQMVTGLLLASGAEIAEINCVRKHLSKIKGGQLGRYFAPATVISLILSDVIGNDLSVIASGPTHPDPSTFAQALAVLEKYHLADRTPPAVMELLRRGVRGEGQETPKALRNCHNVIVGDNMLALQAMKAKAREIGLNACIITSEQKGETTEIARLRASEVASGKYAGFDAMLIGGETTPRLPDGAGKGGRNQHYAAVSMLVMKDFARRWVVCSVGTDGSDFIPEVAGAIVDDSTLRRLAEQNVDADHYVDRYDSYHLLARTGDSLIVTGNTGTNVGDLVVYAVE